MISSHPIEVGRRDAAETTGQYASLGFRVPHAAGPPPSKRAKTDLNFRVMCGDCQTSTPNLIEDFASGDLICRDCGSVVMGRLIDTRSEWRTFSNDGSGASDDPSRVGGPSNPLLAGPDGDTTPEATLISARDGNTGIARDLARLQNKSNLKPAERSLLEAYRTISMMTERIGLPSLIEYRAKMLFKDVDEKKLLRGKSVDGIIAACIYIACRLERVTRTFKEISSLTQVPKKDIGRCYKAMYRALFPKGDPNLIDPSEQNVVQLDSSPPGMGTVSMLDFVARFCSHLNLPNEIQKLVAMVCSRTSKPGCVDGKSPISIAAACIYLVTQLFPMHRKSQRDIAYVAGVSEITIKNTYKDLHPHRHVLVTSDMAPRAAVDALPIS